MAQSAKRPRNNSPISSAPAAAKSADSQATLPRVDLAKIEAGMPLSLLDKFVVVSGVPYAEVYQIVIPARTLKHRKQRREPLNLDESDKFARLVRIFLQALSVFGAGEKARHWLSTPKARFEQRTPLRMLRTEYGGRMVEEMLGQIDDGMFA